MHLTRPASPRSARNSACTRWPSRTPSTSSSGRSSTGTKPPVRHRLRRRAGHRDRRAGDLEIAAFVTHNALVTVRKNEGFDIGLCGPLGRLADLAKHGVAFLLHGLLDFVVDGHFDAVQTLDEQIEDLEDQLFADAPGQRDVQRRSFELRKSLVLLRRIVLPMREVVNACMRRDLHVVDDAMTPYYQDVYDHVLRATEWTESCATWSPPSSRPT